MTGRLSEQRAAATRRHRERGAALVMALLMTMLFMVLAGAVLMATAMTITSTYQMTPEMQGYYGTEAGVQEALNVLRGNVTPHSSLSGTRMNFRNAINPSTSNRQTVDNSSYARLSGWLEYGTGNATDRVPLVPTGTTYDPYAHNAYSLRITDPDNKPASEEPQRLIVQVTGYGPRGAKKELEMMVRRPLSFSPPAPLIFRGADDGSTMTLNLGNSSAKHFTGEDGLSGSSTVKPSFAVSTQDATSVDNALLLSSPVEQRPDVHAPVKTTLAATAFPEFIRTADEARTLTAELKKLAQKKKNPDGTSANSYLTSLNGTVGTTAVPAFVFIDGNCTLKGGAGLLVVTGDLTLDSGTFYGIILVMGNGKVTRNSDARGIYGAMVVAKFGSGNFGRPEFNVSGGDSSSFTIQWHSDWFQRAASTPGFSILGVREK